MAQLDTEREKYLETYGKYQEWIKKTGVPDNQESLLEWYRTQNYDQGERLWLQAHQMLTVRRSNAA